MTFDTTINGLTLHLTTSPSCFSPTRVDRGTLAMLSQVAWGQGKKILDLGCGYGVVGLVAAHYTQPENIYMLDNNPDALLCAQQNIRANQRDGIHVLCSDAYDELQETGFDIILTNPPYHTDFQVPKKFIEKGFNRLKVGGTFYLVTRRRLWYEKKLVSIFGGTRLTEQEGYFVFQSEKRQTAYRKTSSGHFAGPPER